MMILRMRMVPITAMDSGIGTYQPMARPASFIPVNNGNSVFDIGKAMMEVLQNKIELSEAQNREDIGRIHNEKIR